VVTGASFSKIRIGVLMGGKGIEREVSFNSGRTICDHIDSTEYEVIPIFQTNQGALYLLPWHFLHRGKITDFKNRLDKETTKIIWDDLKNLIDFMYIAVHGRYAEDGCVQGFLEVLGIPYLGAKVFGSALGMNKIILREFLKINGIDIPKGIVITTNEITQGICADEILKNLKKNSIDFPCVVKPAHEGSSFGITVVKKEDDLLDSIYKAFKCDQTVEQDVLIEEKIDGMEFVCVCLQKLGDVKDEWFSLPITQVIPEKNSLFFDYDQKYMPGRASKITPASCSSKDQKKIQEACIKATKILNFTSISRIDGFLTKDKRVVLFDPNSLTGMGPATFLFHQAAEVGMSHSQLINYLIKVELQNYGIYGHDKKERISMNSNNPKIRVVVLLGGNTNEREISLESGRNVCYKLAPEKYEVIPVFVNDNMQLYKLDQRLLIQNSTREISTLVTDDIKINWADLPSICDFVFIGLHGGFGENGAVQGALEMLGLPYNGPGVLTSSLGMDKCKTAEFLKAKGFDVPNSILLEKKDWDNLKNKTEKKEFLETLLNQQIFPLVVKPHDDGCSVGVKKTTNISDLILKIDSFFKEFDKKNVLLEEFIDGFELTCGVIGNDKPQAFPPSMSVAKETILSMKEKFLPGEGENITPAPLSKEKTKFIQETMKRAYAALDCKGYTRIDCFFQEGCVSKSGKDRVVILEINTLPAMTPATCLFHQAAEVGLKPMEFVDKIVELGLENHKKQARSSKEQKTVKPLFLK